MTLPGAKHSEDARRADLNLSLEEILKPFAGLSQLLGAYSEFKTMEDLNRMISKAADEFEAMREDKLNDGRPLGPLQVSAVHGHMLSFQNVMLFQGLQLFLQSACVASLLITRGCGGV